MAATMKGGKRGKGGATMKGGQAPVGPTTMRTRSTSSTARTRGQGARYNSRGRAK